MATTPGATTTDQTQNTTTTGFQAGGGSQNQTTQQANVSQAVGSNTGVNNQTQTQTGTGAQANVYSAPQTQLQGQAANAANQFLQTGNLPGTFAQPPQVMQAYVDNFNRSVAPQLAAQYGAGSPAIGSQLALGLEQLQAQLYQTQSGNFGNALNASAGIGFNALGQTQQSSQAGNTMGSQAGTWQSGQTQQGTTNQQSNNSDWQTTAQNLANNSSATSSAFARP